MIKRPYKSTLNWVNMDDSFTVLRSFDSFLGQRNWKSEISFVTSKTNRLSASYENQFHVNFLRCCPRMQSPFGLGRKSLPVPATLSFRLYFFLNISIGLFGAENFLRSDYFTTKSGDCLCQPWTRNGFRLFDECRDNAQVSNPLSRRSIPPPNKLAHPLMDAKRNHSTGQRYFFSLSGAEMWSSYCEIDPRKPWSMATCCENPRRNKMENLPI